MRTPEEIVQEASKTNAQAENGLKSAMDAMIKQSDLYIQAYEIGRLKGGMALKMRDEAIGLAGDIARLHADLIAFHEQGTKLAKDAGIPPSQPYAELPVTTEGGGR